jgi:hypothetical protein
VLSFVSASSYLLFWVIFLLPLCFDTAAIFTTI